MDRERHRSTGGAALLAVAFLAACPPSVAPSDAGVACVDANADRCATPVPNRNCGGAPEPDPCPSTATEGACRVDADCTGGLACLDSSTEGCQCRAPSCVTDDDCGIDQACVCLGIANAFRNACVPASCRVDADCDGAACLLVREECECDYATRALRLRCSTAEDDCVAVSCCGDEECRAPGEGASLHCLPEGDCICD